MNGHFTTEIGRMRCEEMVARGTRYQQQKAELLKRAEEVDRPVVRRHKVHRRILATAILSSLFLAILSTAAFAYPVTPTAGQRAGAQEVVSNVTSRPEVTSSDPFTWILLAAVVCAVLVAFAATGARRVAHS